MSKLLSDEELYEKLEDMHYKLEDTQHTNWDEYNNTLSGFTDLINTQKRLYAESVIGEDEAAADYSYLPPTLDEMAKSAYEKAVRNQLRAEQRRRIK